MLFALLKVELTLTHKRRHRVFENGALSTILGPKSEEVLGGCTDQGGLDGRGMWHVWDRNAQGVWWVNTKERDSLEDLSVYGQYQNGCYGTRDSIYWIYLAQDRDRWRAVVNTVTEHSGSIKCGEFLEYLRNCQVLKDSAPCSYNSEVRIQS